MKNDMDQFFSDEYKLSQSTSFELKRENISENIKELQQNIITGKEELISKPRREIVRGVLKHDKS